MCLPCIFMSFFKVSTRRWDCRIVGNAYFKFWFCHLISGLALPVFLTISFLLWFLVLYLRQHSLLPNFNENVFDLMYEMWHLLWYSFAFQWLQMRLISFSCLLVNFISSATCYSYPLSSLYLCVWICLSFWNWIIEWFYMFRYLVSVIAPFSFNYFSFNYLFSHYFRLRVV